VAALISQAIFEFGPLWLVSLDAPPALFGPYWAALVSTLGLGGFLISRLHFDRRVTVLGLACVGPAAALALTVSHSLAVMIVAQGALALLVAIVGIHAGRLMHDAVPSTIRSGVSSGVGTLSWVLFLPFSLVFGWLANQQGVNDAGWMLTGAAVLVASLLVVSLVTSSDRPAPAVEADWKAADLACKELVELITDYLDGVLPADWRAGIADHLSECDGCTEYTRQIRFTLQALSELSTAEGPRPGTGSTDATDERS
jgi:MFS family permease